ncbi:glycosyltransferase family 61 protein, partial [Escherichia coli]|uniref:glycosyltransferase family 61 protein n=1 Tax=Escherichia coli TaxID=562 RepID=UPI0013B03AEC
SHWFYPNYADIKALRTRLSPLIENPYQKPKRIYVSRAGRRRVINEDALTAMLSKYDFMVMEDKPRTLAEQLTLYNRASFILGPHGASFTNIIWCEPGTPLYELFSPSYAPVHFRYLAQVTGMHYSAYYQGRPNSTGKKAMEENVIVSVSDIERGVNKLLEQEHKQ